MRPLPLLMLCKNEVVNVLSENGVEVPVETDAAWGAECLGASSVDQRSWRLVFEMSHNEQGQLFRFVRVVRSCFRCCAKKTRSVISPLRSIVTLVSPSLP